MRQSPHTAFRRARGRVGAPCQNRSEEHTSELQSHHDLVCRLLLEKKKKITNNNIYFNKKITTYYNEITIQYVESNYILSIFVDEWYFTASYVSSVVICHVS